MAGLNGHTAIGSDALYSNTTAGFLTACGIYALYSNTTGISNTACGAETLRLNTTGSENSGLGSYALYNNQAVTIAPWLFGAGLQHDWLFQYRQR
ncbi:MAG: hypothetical protein IPK99_09525 [Flavobacteriales bacterium]|nr:hypothetical protein [Flavobacteriales bacterium]